MAVKSVFRYFLRIGILVFVISFFSFVGVRFSKTSANLLQSLRSQVISNPHSTLNTTALFLYKDPPPNLLSGMTEDWMDPQLCNPKRKIIFAKTHKTGSSTIQNILMRFGLSKNLTFVLPAKKSWMFPLTQSFSADMVDRSNGDNFGLMVFHHIWNASEVKKLIPGGMTLTLLRDPVDTFESGYVYLGLQRGYNMDINEFAAKRARRGATRPFRAVFNKNPQLYDLGLNQTKLEDTLEVIQKIHQLEKDFDFVMIAEHMDESLILLQDLLCWPLIDLTYLKQNERKTASKSNMTEETRRILREWLWADYLLYNHFLDKFVQRRNEYGKDYLDYQVERLKDLNRRVSKECVLSHSDNSKLKGDFRMALDIVLGYVVDEKKPWCKQYAVSEPTFWKMIYRKQHVTVESIFPNFLHGIV